MWNGSSGGPGGITCLVTSEWIRDQFAISAEQIRMYRIYQEVGAAGGDIRALCGLIGMSITNAARWATTIDHISEPPANGGSNTAGLPRGR
jgi:hypothetical protein